MNDVLPALMAGAFILIGVAAWFVAVAARRIHRNAIIASMNAGIDRGIALRREERLRRSEAAKKGHQTRTHKQAVNDPIVAAALELRS